ncbi:protein of unknown function [Taphrina deformans PYCC 5710]|uniref:tRNA(M5U54)methyltransferase n=1 Tax=Taphrina deformans (strain PYCC 5710 / ATCC 11124 / CBS 356.35 / IMI 108563 / JCM 9778 / NBRC 8474) TaxID=1097556 RepID=R4XDY0_TAPDE|nr:protein of unknown function [Taphrina deformans PYCC 5710]|eukprot:CCG83857.1 protein of unknown function [Taphrina deformans PYCC 5710]
MASEKRAASSNGSSNRPHKKVKQTKPKAGSSTDQVLLKDIEKFHALLSEQERDVEITSFVKFEPLEVNIKCLNSSADGMGYVGGYTAIVPFTMAGDKVSAKPYYINDSERILLCDLESITVKADGRDEASIRCKYFGKCSGCQMQEIPYQVQLAHKRKVVEDAFENFSNLAPDLLPVVGETIGSPIQYNYRTKITPHFDQPRRGFALGEYPQIGFNEKGRRKVMDIEECPIATEALNQGLTRERTKVLDNLKSFKRGATLLLRQHSTQTESGLSYSCVSDSKDIITEYIGKYKFQSPAGAFFQNNNAIMPLLTEYVRENLLKDELTSSDHPERFLVDAYCGSGLFSITCSNGFAAVNGVEISQDSVKWAKINAQTNGIENIEFLAGSAEALFEKIKFPPAQTSMILDPPRKGCDTIFLEQLLAFSPERIVYVSCCVQTQARDIGYILNHSSGKDYTVESIRGFDLFPNTYHVEGVCVLQKKHPSVQS